MAKYPAKIDILMEKGSSKEDIKPWLLMFLEKHGYKGNYDVSVEETMFRVFGDFRIIIDDVVYECLLLGDEGTYQRFLCYPSEETLMKLSKNVSKNVEFGPGIGVLVKKLHD